jgi:hypothetical protein
MVWGTNGGSTPVAYTGWGSPIADGEFRNSVQDSGLSSSTLWGGPRLNEIENSWVRIEVYLRQSSGAQANGAFQVWTHSQNGIQLVQSNTNYQTRTSDTRWWRQWHFGSYHATDDPSDATAEVYLDDVYFDRTRARVELCDSSSWNARRRCEVQVTTAWANGQITVNPAQGAFQKGSTVYLYVVDASGRVSNSSPVVF